MKKSPVIVLACGGTGGHIFPGISTADELKKRDPQTRTIFVCGKRDIENAIFKVVRGQKVVSIDSAPYRGKISLINPFFWWPLARGVAASWQLLRFERPDAVIGFGGYFSFPVILAAKMLRIPTLVHEQNVVPGVANKKLMGWADAVALSFEETEKYLGPHPKRRVTGNPIRASIERPCRDEALDFFGFSPQKRTVLVVGGSQGAESINTFFLGALGRLPLEMKKQLQVLHLCGRMDPKVSEQNCRSEGIAAVKAFSFFERMDLAYGAADLCVGRAGATFLAEIMAKNLPAILVPYPFGSGHQRDNAEVFRKNGRASVIEQSELSDEKMAGLLVEGLERSRGAEPDVRPADSRQKLVDLIYDCIR